MQKCWIHCVPVGTLVEYQIHLTDLDFLKFFCSLQRDFVFIMAFILGKYK